MDYVLLAAWCFLVALGGGLVGVVLGNIAHRPRSITGMTGDELSAALTEEPASPAGVRLGGMALRNGLLVHGPDHWAVALRSRDGGITVESGR